jgi:hypothetical protein
MRKISITGAALALSVAAMCQPAAASVLYDNGPIDGTVNALFVDNGQAIGDTFTLSSAATVTGVTFGAWTASGQAITGIDWGITNAYGVVAYNATAAVTDGPVLFTNGYGYDISTDSFSAGGLSLSAGSYYLWLQNATGTNAAAWDVNNGPSASYFAEGGTFYGSTGYGSEAFQILGGAGVPEPATWTMMLLGVGCIGGAQRSRRGTVAATV